jgi:serine/threonine protein kinase
LDFNKTLFKFNTILSLIAPELMRLMPYGHAVDWWALGIIAYCLLDGQVGALFFLNIVRSFHVLFIGIASVEAECIYAVFRESY